MALKVPYWTPFVSAVAATVVASWAVVQFAENRAEAKAAAGVRAAAEAKADLEAHKQHSAMVHETLLRAVQDAASAAERSAEESYRARLEIRALYDHALFGRRQPVLESAPPPPPKGGSR